MSSPCVRAQSKSSLFKPSREFSISRYAIRFVSCQTSIFDALCIIRFLLVMWHLGLSSNPKHIQVVISISEHDFYSQFLRQSRYRCILVCSESLIADYDISLPRHANCACSRLIPHLAYAEVLGCILTNPFRSLKSFTPLNVVPIVLSVFA